MYHNKVKMKRHVICAIQEPNIIIIIKMIFL